MESNEKKAESGVRSLLQTSSKNCILSCNFRGSLVISEVAEIIMAVRTLTMVVRQSCHGKISIRRIFFQRLFVKTQALKDILAGHNREGKTQQCRFLSLEEPYYEIFSLSPSWIMTPSSQFRRMKWNSNCHSNCSGGKKKLGVELPFLGSILVDWSGFSCPSEAAAKLSHTPAESVDNNVAYWTRASI